MGLGAVRGRQIGPGARSAVVDTRQKRGLAVARSSITHDAPRPTFGRSWAIFMNSSGSASRKEGIPGSGHLTIASADANRSCGPPKPGRRLLNGVRRCPRRSAGGPLGPDKPPEGPWGRRGVPMLQGVRTSIVHRYGTVERSVEPCQVLLCQNRVPTENPSEPDMARQATMGPDG